MRAPDAAGIRGRLIRPSSEQLTQVNVGLRITGSQARIDAMSLKDYIGLAYRLMPQQIDGPEWLAQLRFNIAATIPDGASTEKVPEMFQALGGTDSKNTASRLTHDGHRSTS